ncbi:MAG: DUF5677 domain-containing protein [Gammaproteobacteria bacterium]
MAKKKSKKHIANKKFTDRNLSSIGDHVRHGKRLKSPWSKIQPTFTPSSWHERCVPNALWACILAGNLERDHCLDLFRHFVKSTREDIPEYETTFVTHNFLATLADNEFDVMFKHALSDPQANKLLSALLAVEWLPDRSHWKRHLTEVDPAQAGATLARAVAACYDHQSQEATDVRWLKLLHFAVSGRIVLPPEMAERLQLYPNKGDMREVRPSIRAMELGLRMIEFGEEPIDLEKKALPPHRSPLPKIDIEEFWVEMKAKTECVFPYNFSPPKQISPELRDEIINVYRSAQTHFDETITTTGFDPRHDGAFGLTLYALSLLVSTAYKAGHDLAEGRIVLRIMLELFVTLEYLAKKDDIALWKQYRAYGAGQAKLAFLKNISNEESPFFLDLEMLERLANEDVWMDFQDIDLGQWNGTNLRTMATEAGVKPEYDKYYDWLSGFVHGQWATVRDSVFVNGLNPLHRFHRIPGPPVMVMPSILPDACKLANRMLDTLNSLYPTFKPRLKVYKKEFRPSPVAQPEKAPDAENNAN